MIASDWKISVGSIAELKRAVGTAVAATATSTGVADQGGLRSVCLPRHSGIQRWVLLSIERVRRDTPQQKSRQHILLRPSTAAMLMFLTDGGRACAPQSYSEKIAKELGHDMTVSHERHNLGLHALCR